MGPAPGHAAIEAIQGTLDDLDSNHPENTEEVIHSTGNDVLGFVCIENEAVPMLTTTSCWSGQTDQVVLDLRRRTTENYEHKLEKGS